MPDRRPGRHRLTDRARRLASRRWCPACSHVDEAPEFMVGRAGRWRRHLGAAGPGPQLAPPRPAAAAACADDQCVRCVQQPGDRSGHHRWLQPPRRIGVAADGKHLVEAGPARQSEWAIRAGVHLAVSVAAPVQAGRRKLGDRSAGDRADGAYAARQRSAGGRLPVLDPLRARGSDRAGARSGPEQPVGDGCRPDVQRQVLRPRHLPLGVLDHRQRPDASARPGRPGGRRRDLPPSPARPRQDPRGHAARRTAPPVPEFPGWHGVPGEVSGLRLQPGVDPGVPHLSRRAVRHRGGAQPGARCRLPVFRRRRPAVPGHPGSALGPLHRTHRFIRARHPADLGVVVFAEADSRLGAVGSHLSQRRIRRPGSGEPEPAGRVRGASGVRYRRPGLALRSGLHRAHPWPASP